MFSLPASTRTTLSGLNKYHLNNPYCILFLPKKLSLKKKSDAMHQWSWDSQGFIIYQESLTDRRIKWATEGPVTALTDNIL